MARIVLIGDVHGLDGPLNHIVENHGCFAARAVIQVGDMGWRPGTSYRPTRGGGLNQRPYFQSPTHPVYWLDGNHDWHPALKDITEVTEVQKNLFYVPRGTAIDFGGIRVGFLGGADSVDKEIRRCNAMHWWKEEQISEEDVARAKGIGPVDLLVTHAPPRSAVAEIFKGRDSGAFFTQMGWVKDTTSEERIQEVWDHLGNPPLVCGHLHQSWSRDNVTVLDELEIKCMEF